MSEVFRSVPVVPLIVLAVYSHCFCTLADGQPAPERWNRERRIRGYDLGRPTRSRSSRGRIEHFAYRPTIDGIPLLNGEIAIHLDDQGRTIRSAENGLPREPRSRTFSITKERASELAAEALGASPNAAVHAQQVYFVAPQTTEPAFQIYVETPREGAFEVVISATGANRSA